jgi:DNA-binding HxlR family transcriptional regulator
MVVYQIARGYAADMGERNYRQVCGVARSLDLLGDRWTLLIVRELLLGPKRFGALAGALPGIGPNLLSARLSKLVTGGIVERGPLPPPASSAGYHLTEAGEGLREPVEAFAVWGYDLIDPEDAVARGELARGSWLASSLAARSARRSSGTKLREAVVNFDVDGDRFYVAVDADRAHVRHGERTDATADLTCDLSAFYEMTRRERPAGDPEVDRVLAALAEGD